MLCYIEKNLFMDRKIKTCKKHIYNDPSTILFSKKIIYIGNSIDIISYEIIISQILCFKLLQNSRNINLFLNFSNTSKDLLEEIYTINLYCLLNSSNLDISAVNLGLVKGIFSILLLSASRKKRFGCRNSQIALYSLKENSWITQNNNSLDKFWINETFSNNYLFMQFFVKTNLKNKQIHNLFERNIFLNALDSIKFGFNLIL
uniref:Clp protease n=1 Tax=Lotharella vacuolata TaxID=74820 RepID=A0A0H5BQV3_9EUKA|nr:clp protease [Lotharella vacuolata]